jgi:hypothetical protein
MASGLGFDPVSEHDGKVAHPEDDAEWDADQRGETPLERLDRNWADLLQELRVVQTGVQLLTGFLLTLPFQARFAQLHQFEENLYLSTVGLAIASTGFLIAPVLIHRIAAHPVDQRNDGYHADGDKPQVTHSR